MGIRSNPHEKLQEPHERSLLITSTTIRQFLILLIVTLNAYYFNNVIRFPLWILADSASIVVILLNLDFPTFNLPSVI